MIWIAFFMACSFCLSLGWILRSLMPTEEQIAKQQNEIDLAPSLLINQGENVVMLSDGEIAALERELMNKRASIGKVSR